MVKIDYTLSNELCIRYVYNDSGYLISRYYSTGWGMKWTRDKFGNVLTMHSSSGLWERYVRDEGKVLSYKDSGGCWYDYTYDKGGKVLTYKDSEGTEISYE